MLFGVSSRLLLVRQSLVVGALNRVYNPLTVVDASRVVFELGLGHITVQVLLAHRMMRSADLSLQARPEAFDAVRRHDDITLNANVFA